MPQVLSMSNGKPETIFSPKDFEELIDRYMGFDSANHYRSQVEQLTKCINGLTEYINDEDILSEVKEVLKVHGY